MQFPTDNEIKEYSAYVARSEKIYMETFREIMKRDPLEFEIDAFLRNGTKPIGYTLEPRKETANGQKQENGIQGSNQGQKQITPKKNIPSQEQKKKTEEVVAKFNSDEIAKEWRLKYPDRPVLEILSETEIGIGQYLRTENGNHFPEVAKVLGDIGWPWDKDQSVFVWKGAKA